MDATFILTKNAILEKVKDLLLELQEKQENFLHHPQLFTAADYKKKSPKISKGENYKGLPYLMLDYPRIFDNFTIFAIRTMFWWGNFFSVTLHLSGKYKDEFADKICNNAINCPAHFFICVHTDPWQHHFAASNYVSLNGLGEKEIKKSLPGYRETHFIRPFSMLPVFLFVFLFA